MKFAAHSLLLISLAATFAHAQTNNIPQVQHVIVVIQENRSPDNLFNQDSTLVANGGNVQPSYQGNVNYAPPCNVNGSGAIQLQGQYLFTCWDTEHNHSRPTPDWINMWDGGQMDGACQIGVKWTDKEGSRICPVSQTPPTCVLTHKGNKSLIQNCSYTYVANVPGTCPGPMCNQGILDPYFYLANHLGFANNMFQTNQGPSFPAHQFLLSGTSAPLGYSSSNPPMCSDGTNSWACYKWFDAENGNLSLTGCIGDQIPQESLAYSIAPLTGSDSDEAHVYTPGYPVNQFAGFPCYEHATLTDLLDNASPSISWRYYARSVGNLWTAPAAIQHMCLPSGYGGYCTGYDFTGGGNPLPPKVELPTYKPADNSGDAAPILTEIQNCALPTVSWVIPDGNWSDHAGGVWTTEKGDGGPSWVSAIVNQVAQATNCDTNNAHPGYWYDTVILVTWDDWGGYYDHVVPPDCATSPCTGYPNGTGFQYVYGFRVPLLVVGAYVNQTGNPGGAYTGYISN